MLLLVSAAAAALMGFAVQRGATCTVAAVGDIVKHRHWDRTIALAEAALWVAAGLLAAQAAGLAMSLPRGFAPAQATVVGGVLLGLGAVVNGACVFDAIARLGSGKWAFAAAQLGSSPAAYCCSGSLRPRCRCRAGHRCSPGRGGWLRWSQVSPPGAAGAH